MPPFLALVLVLLPYKGRLYDRTFSPITELAPRSREEARAAAKPGPSLERARSKILAAFAPGARMPRWSSVRLAAELGGNWLYVDRAGDAEYGGEGGRFDVLAWERLLRREPSLRAIPRSDLVRLRIENRTGEEVRLMDGAGFTRARVPARQTRTVSTWFTAHRVLQAGKRIGDFDLDFFSSTRPINTNSSLSFARLGTDASGHWKPAGRHLYEARLIVRG